MLSFLGHNGGASLRGGVGSARTGESGGDGSRWSWGSPCVYADFLFILESDGLFLLFFAIELHELSMCFGYGPLTRYELCRGVRSGPQPFHGVGASLCRAEAFWFDVAPLVCVCFCGFCFRCHNEKIVTRTDAKELAAGVFSRSFIIPRNTFKSLVSVGAVGQRPSRSLASGHPVLPTSPVGDCSFPFERSWLLCGTLVDRVSLGLFWAPSSAPHTRVSASCHDHRFAPV